MEDPIKFQPPDEQPGDETLPESLQRDLEGLYLPGEPIEVPGEIDQRLMQMAQRRLSTQVAATAGRARGLSWKKAAPSGRKRQVLPLRLVAMSAAAAAILLVVVVAPRFGTSPLPVPGGTSLAIRGDIDEDGRVDIVDALLLAKIAAGESTRSTTASSADMNDDGVVDGADAAAIRRSVVQLEGGAG